MSEVTLIIECSNRSNTKKFLRRLKKIQNYQEVEYLFLNKGTGIRWWLLRNKILTIVPNARVINYGLRAESLNNLSGWVVLIKDTTIFAPDAIYRILTSINSATNPDYIMYQSSRYNLGEYLVANKVRNSIITSDFINKIAVKSELLSKIPYQFWFKSDRDTLISMALYCASSRPIISYCDHDILTKNKPQEIEVSAIHYLQIEYITALNELAHITTEDVCKALGWVLISRFKNQDYDPATLTKHCENQ